MVFGVWSNLFVEWQVHVMIRYSVRWQASWRSTTWEMQGRGLAKARRLSHKTCMPLPQRVLVGGIWDALFSMWWNQIGDFLWTRSMSRPQFSTEFVRATHTLVLAQMDWLDTSRITYWPNPTYSRSDWNSLMNCLRFTRASPAVLRRKCKQ